MEGNRTELRKVRGKKRQREVAEAVGITTSYYGMIEKGVRNPSLNLAKRIADFYCEKLEDLFFTN